MKKLLIIAAGVAGYVLGTRAGRARYEQIREQSSKVWNSPTVQQGVDQATDLARQGASAAGSSVADAASSAGASVAEAASSAASTATEKVTEKLSGSDEKSGVDLDGPPAAKPDPAAPKPGSADGPLPRTTPTSVSSPPTAGDLDPNKNL